MKAVGLAALMNELMKLKTPNAVEQVTPTQSPSSWQASVTSTMMMNAVLTCPGMISKKPSGVNVKMAMSAKNIAVTAILRDDILFIKPPLPPFVRCSTFFSPAEKPCELKQVYHNNAFMLTDLRQVTLLRPPP